MCWILNRTLDFNTEKLNNDELFSPLPSSFLSHISVITENGSRIDSLRCDYHILRKSAIMVLRRAAFSLFYYSGSIKVDYLSVIGRVA